MFEKFTDRARRVIVLAQEEARMLRHNYIGTEHILLGVLHEGGGVAGSALDSLGVTLEAARERVVAIVGRGEDQLSGHIPFTPRSKKVLELSLREALNLGHTYIGPEHILLGLIREGEGVATHVLRDLGVSAERARETVIGLIHEGGAGVEAGIEPELGPAGPRVVGTPVQLEGIMRQLSVINARLAAIERQLGLGSVRPAAPDPADEPSADEPPADEPSADEPSADEPPAGGPPDEAGSAGEAGPQAG